MIRLLPYSQGGSVVFQKFDTQLGCHCGHPGGAGGSIPLRPLLPLRRGNYRKEGTGLFNELRDYSPFFLSRIGPKSNRQTFPLFARKTVVQAESTNQGRRLRIRRAIMAVDG